MAIRILVLAERFPRPDFNSGDRRLVAMLELMARTHRVDFVVPVPVIGEQQAEGQRILRQTGIYVLGSGWSAFVRALARTSYHVALFEFYTTFQDHAPIVRERQPAAVLVTDSVDVHFAREAAAATLGLGTTTAAATTRERELEAYRASDAVIVVTKEDQEILLREGGMPSLFVVPNSVPIRQRAECSRGPEVLFIGGFQHLPNIDAVLWFVHEILPLVHRAVPSVIFNVVGSNPPDEIKALAAVPSVRLLGYVRDTAPFLDRAAVSVAPLRYGAGMKGKVNEALAAAVPVVTTSYGVQGIPAVSGVHLVVADAAEQFAATVVRLLTDNSAASAIGAAGQELAKAFAPERIGELIEAMLTELVPHPRAFAPRLRWLSANMRAGFRALRRT